MMEAFRAIRPRWRLYMKRSVSWCVDRAMIPPAGALARPGAGSGPTPRPPLGSGNRSYDGRLMDPASPNGRDWLREIARRALRLRGFEPDFPPAVVAEADRLTGQERPTGVEDQRALDWVSIDNDDSRDLDQLSVAEPLADGSVQLFVAVADVDAAVRRGGAIDEHARTNTTSVYTPAQVFPMLPERLSTDLTSLNEAEDRLAIVVRLTVQRDGTV